MDLGIQGKSAIICASSRGLGKACASSLAANGVNIVLNGREQKVLNETASAISKKFSNINIQVVSSYRNFDHQKRLRGLNIAFDV